VPDARYFVFGNEKPHVDVVTSSIGLSSESGLVYLLAGGKSCALCESIKAGLMGVA
jgi:hypothetical protein